MLAPFSWEGYIVKALVAISLFFPYFMILAWLVWMPVLVAAFYLGGTADASMPGVCLSTIVCAILYYVVLYDPLGTRNSDWSWVFG